MNDSVQQTYLHQLFAQQTMAKWSMNLSSTSHSITLQAGIPVLVLLALYYYFRGGQRPWSGFPVISLTDKVPSPWSGPDPDLEAKAAEIVEKGKATTNGCFQIKTGTGFKIVVPNRFAHELRNHKSLSIAENNRIDFMTDYHGFDGMRQGSREDHLMQEVIRVKLIPSLPLVTGDIIDEVTCAMKKTLGDRPDWNSYPVRDVILDIVARTTTRVFAGKELSRDDAWVHIAKQNTINTFAGAEDLVKTPALLRPLRQWFIPSIKELRRETSQARELLAPHTKARLAAMAESNTRPGQGKSAVTANSWAWFADQAKGRPVDFVAGQLFLSIVAIHTTTEITTRCILQLCQMPEIVTALREEIIPILQEHGWNKTSLYQMKLLDSFIKEVHRTHPLATATMGRYARTDFKLSDGITISKGSSIIVLDDGLTDPNNYPDPDIFHAQRFMNLRQLPGQESKHQYVATASQNLSFGIGEHACPGRFFASNEIKIILCTLLLNYDMTSKSSSSSAAADTPPITINTELTCVVDPQATIRLRKRQAEIDVTQLPTT